jgi:type I restriction enzyme S subunit
MEERELPVGWAVAPLEAVVEILDSTRVPVNTTERDRRIAGKEKQALYPYYGATGQVGWIDDYLFDEELVLLGEDGVPFFDPLKKKAYIAEGKFWVNNHAHVIRPTKGACDPAFLQPFLNQFDYTGYVTGSTRLKLTQAAMREIPIVLAPYSEQHRIAAKLDTTLAAVDACRQRLDGVAAILKRFRQAVLAAATSGELTREWREMQQHEEWQTMTLGELISDGPKNGLYKPKSIYGHGVRILRIDNFYDGSITNWAQFKRLRLGTAEREEYALAHGDLVVNRVNSMPYLGKTALIEDPPEECVFESNMMRIRFRQNAILPAYANLFLCSPMGISRLRKGAKQAVNQASINQQDVKAVSVPLPSVSEQEEVISRAQGLFALADQLEARLTAARKVVDRLTPALLAKAFRGELVPQDPSDEPASVLLERIRAARQAESGVGKPSRRGRRKAAASPEQAPLPAAPAPSDLLAQLLQECGALSQRALLAASELDPDRFLVQLELERASGAVRETCEDGQAVLEAA